MTVRILTGSCIERLKDLPDQSVQCVITSPPYWGLRSYKGDPGMIGLEPTFERHLDNLVAVFREVWRVLRDDGVVWLNYAAFHCDSGKKVESKKYGIAPHKPKDLCDAPSFVAEALRADGWYKRSAVVWSKPNPKPESAKDRPTVAYEMVYLLTKKPKYFYDHFAVKTRPAEESVARLGRDLSASECPHDGQIPPSADKHKDFKKYGKRVSESMKKAKKRGHKRPEQGFIERWDSMSKAEQQANGANLRDVWHIPVFSFKGPHFATFPPKLVEPCIKAGTSEHGACAECGAPWKREIRYSGGTIVKAWHDHSDNLEKSQRVSKRERQAQRIESGTTPKDEDKIKDGTYKVECLGFRPTCECSSQTRRNCVVLDPFGGAGTTALVADRLGLDAVLIEISPEYAEMAKNRIEGDAPLLTNVEIDAADC